MGFSTGTFDHVFPNDPQPGLPLRLSLMPDRGRTIARSLLVIPTLLLLLAPTAFAATLMLRKDALPSHDTVTMLALLVQPAVWIALSAVALLAIIPRLGRKRVIIINEDTVSALEASLTGTWAWRMPTSSYRGIAHHVRATSGVVGHEIILVHADPARSVLLHTSSMVTQASLDHFCALLRMPLIPSREVYRLPLGTVRLPRWDWLRRQKSYGTAEIGELATDGRAA